jgi:hypothetical protein
MKKIEKQLSIGWKILPILTKSIRISFHSPDGTFAWVMDKPFLENSEKMIVSYVGTVTDITE